MAFLFSREKKEPKESFKLVSNRVIVVKFIVGNGIC